uniref:Transposase n=1 Tax=Ascaris lumbricoides TaxID=6252 RepID=A0A0M3HHM8_ASCLU
IDASEGGARQPGRKCHKREHFIVSFACSLAIRDIYGSAVSTHILSEDSVHS